MLEYIAKLRKVVDGALACDTDVAKEQRQWWEGYREALDVMQAFAESEIPPAETGSTGTERKVSQ
jgi:hypothetical protein